MGTKSFIQKGKQKSDIVITVNTYPHIAKQIEDYITIIINHTELNDLRLLSKAVQSPTVKQQAINQLKKLYN